MPGVHHLEAMYCMALLYVTRLSRTTMSAQQVGANSGDILPENEGCTLFEEEAEANPY
jgi:hypothetical protein